MSDKSGRDLEQELRRSLHAAAPHPAPDMADRLLARTAAIEQRRGWGGLAFVPALGAAAVVVVAVVAGIAFGDLLPRTDPPGVGPSSVAVSPTPSPSVAPTPTPSQAPSAAPSAAVFPGGGVCENESLGYTVGYPAGWYANEAIEPQDGLDGVEACQYFAEEPMEIRPNAGLPPTVAIVFSRGDEELPSSGITISSEETTIAGRPATVTESEGTGDGPFFAEGDFSYGYQITLPDGRFLVASTYYANDGDYETHKLTLDQMMETLELIGS